MMAGGSHACYNWPGHGALAQCSKCNSTKYYSKDPNAFGCSNTARARGVLGGEPYCDLCCPQNYTETFFAEHPEAYWNHPPTFLIQTELDSGADSCASVNYHRTMLAHHAWSEIAIVPLDQQRCFSIGNPGDPAVPAADTFQRFCSEPNATSLNHTQGFAGMVVPLTNFLIRALNVSSPPPAPPSSTNIPNQQENRHRSAASVERRRLDTPADDSVIDPSDGTRTQCAMRRLAYQRGLELQRFRGVSMPDLFDALQLHNMCGETTLPTSHSSSEQVIPEHRSEDFNPDAIHVHAKRVSVYEALEQWRASGHSSQIPLLLHDGVHTLNETLELTAADSGLRIAAAPGAEHAWLSGGVELSGLQWKPAKGKPEGVLVADVSAFSLTEIVGLYDVDAKTNAPSTRYQRARYPNGNWERDLWGLCSTNDCLDLGPAYTTPQRWGGTLSGPNASMTKAAAVPKAEIERWWSAGNATTKGWGLPKQHPFLNTTKNGEACAAGSRNCTTWEFALGCGGPCKHWGSWDSNPDNAGCQYWCGDIGNPNIHGCGGGPFEAAMSKDGWLGVPIGVTFRKQSKVRNRMQYWRQPAVGVAQMIVHAWMDSSWFTNQFAVTNLDIHAGSLSFDDPSNPGYPKGGWQGAHSWSPGSTGEPGSESVAPMIIENVEAELDAPAEFFFDAASSQLFLFPNSTDGRPPSRLVATKLKVLVSARGTQETPVSNVSINGVGFRDSATPMIDTRWGVPSGGDWALPHTGTLHLHGVSNVTISNCLFVRLDNTAVLLSGYTRDVKIVRNVAKWLGMGFAAAWGDTDGVDGTAGTQPQRTLLDSNFVSEIGITQKQSSFWFQAKSCLNTVVFPSSFLPHG